MRNFIFISISFVLLSFGSPVHAKSCSSDFNCGIGYACIKESFKSRGVCMKEVDSFGTPTYRMPKSSSIGIGSADGDCDFNLDCPIGFKCDRKYKVCVKK